MEAAIAYADVFTARRRDGRPATIADLMIAALIGVERERAAR